MPFIINKPSIMKFFRNAVFSPFLLGAVWNVDTTAAFSFSTILTETVFNQIAPNAAAPYTYSGFVTAVNSWNQNHTSNLIFSGITEMDQRQELAAFFGNTLHESDAFRAPREYAMCSTYQVNGNEMLCEVPAQFDTVGEQYCSIDHTDPPKPYTEDGCNCELQSPVTSTGLDYELLPANELYFGRGKCNNEVQTID
jgi:hypothetical protein